MSEHTEPNQVPEPAEPVKVGARVQVPEHGRSRPRRRGLVLGIVGAVVLVGGGVTAAVLANREPTAPVTPPAVTITNPVPTAAVAPAPREEPTPLVAALPDTVLQWAFAGVEDAEGPGDALESYRVTYTDGAGGDVVLEVTQLRDADAARATAGARAGAFAEATPDGTATLLPVVIGGAQTSEATIRAVPSGTGGATWVNGTVAFHAEGPADGIEDFFRAFPL